MSRGIVLPGSNNAGGQYVPSRVRPGPPCLPGMAHRWRYDEPAGPTVVGRCRHCAAEHMRATSSPEYSAEELRQGMGW